MRCVITTLAHTEPPFTCEIKTYNVFLPILILLYYFFSTRLSLTIYLYIFFLHFLWWHNVFHGLFILFFLHFRQAKLKLTFLIFHSSQAIFFFFLRFDYCVEPETHSLLYSAMKKSIVCILSPTPLRRILFPPRIVMRMFLSFENGKKS